MQILFKIQKSLKLHLLLCIGIFPFYGKSAIITVDNTTGVKANYTTISAAITAANAGDTIIVMPTDKHYAENINITKKLYIYSRGHTSKFESSKSATIDGSINFNTGSDYTIFSGFYINVPAYVGQITFTGNYINFINNYASRMNVYYGDFFIYIRGSSCIIQGNVLKTDFTNFYFESGGAYPSNNQILNNLIIQSGGSPVAVNGYSSNIFNHNVMVETQTTSGKGINFFSNSYVKVYNNILWSKASGRTSFDTGSIYTNFRNNLTYSANSSVRNLPGAGNINDTMPEFETSFSSSNPPDFNVNNNFRLKAGKLGKNASTDSTDIGLFGGDFNFSMEGNTPGCGVFDDFFVVNPVVRKKSNLKVKIVVRKPEQ